MLAADCICLVILVDFHHELFTVFRLLPSLSELIWGTRHSVLPTLAYDAHTLLWTGHGCEKVRSCLAFWALKPHLLEVLLSCRGGPEKYLPAFVQDNGLVEDIVDRLR